MQAREIIKIKPFKNAYCDVIACGLGAFLNINDEEYKQIEKTLTREEVETLCHYVVVKNKLAGVKEVNLKVPYVKTAIKYLDKYGLDGYEVLNADYVNGLATKDLVGGRFMLEIDNINDYNGGLLSDINDFCATTDTPILIHFGRTLESVGQTVNKFGLSPAGLLEDYGFLDRECYLYGMNYIDKDDQILLSNYSPTLILSPRSDGEDGNGQINLYNLLYNRLFFCFSSGKCYNINMLREGKLALLNTNNLMNKSGLVPIEDVLNALQIEGEMIDLMFDSNKKQEALLEEGRLVNSDTLIEEKLMLEDKINQIVKRLKGEI